jgi:ssDNA-binding Zn-finger/Zn-ribbon topoisomerase 1
MRKRYSQKTGYEFFGCCRYPQCTGMASTPENAALADLKAAILDRWPTITDDDRRSMAAVLFSQYLGVETAKASVSEIQTLARVIPSLVECDCVPHTDDGCPACRGTRWMVPAAVIEAEGLLPDKAVPATTGGDEPIPF